jgi:hypothetical protein
LRRVSSLFLLFSFLAVPRLGAQNPAGMSAAERTAAGLPPGYVGPPPPKAPAVIARDAAGHVVVRASRISSPLQIDGRLDEAIYEAVPPMSGFLQTEPSAGEPATERTDVWVFFDREHIYVVGRCWETHPERMTANEMRRDSTNVAQNDNFAWSFDTFYDRRNGFVFQTNPLGGRMDGQATNQDSINFDWNPVWEIAARRFEQGWVIEAAIPFTSLRYGPGSSQVWGFQVRRRNIWKNEVSYLAPIPAEIGVRGLRPSLSATLVGLEVPSGSRNLEIKPYAISDLTADRGLDGDFGGDVKYGITQNLTADFTYNTDFAQVEADEQQINLTRFNLQFPEKRDFFLESRGIFALAGEGGDTPSLFYSRRIGLEDMREIPIRAGGRITGRAGGFNVGVIDVQTKTAPASGTRPELPAANFSVLRVKRDILRRSSIGALITGRSVNTLRTGNNVAYAADASFMFHDKLTINTYWARTRTEGRLGNDVSYRAFADYNGDRYGAQLERLVINDNFNPEVGFVRRDDIRRSFGLVRFSPRPRSIRAVRKFSWTGSLAHVEDGSGRLDTRDADLQFGTEFQNGDLLNVGYTASHDAAPQSFRIVNVLMPAGEYDWTNLRGTYTFGQQRSASGAVSVEQGTFYDGHRTALTITGARLKVTPKLSAQPSYSANWIDLSPASFSTQLVGSRVTYTVTPLMFLSALVQFNSTTHTVASNVRFRWEYMSGSELFIVYNDQRDTLGSGSSSPANRALIAKITKLFQF